MFQRHKLERAEGKSYNDPTVSFFFFFALGSS